MPMNRKLYPPNWNEIALQIKTEANWICQECDRPCRRVGESLAEFVERIQGWSHADLDWINQTAVSTICNNPTRFVLTVAHLDHDPWNPNARLKALCAPCHCRYDLKAMGLKRRIKREREGQLTLFQEVDP
ncbi:MAG TPA: HNH endonuclease [Trichocoleus sp.]